MFGPNKYECKFWNCMKFSGKTIPRRISWEKKFLEKVFVKKIFSEKFTEKYPKNIFKKINFLKNFQKIFSREKISPKGISWIEFSRLIVYWKKFPKKIIFFVSEVCKHKTSLFLILNDMLWISISNSNIKTEFQVARVELISIPNS